MISKRGNNISYYQELKNKILEKYTELEKINKPIHCKFKKLFFTSAFGCELELDDQLEEYKKNISETFGLQINLNHHFHITFAYKYANLSNNENHIYDKINEIFQKNELYIFNKSNRHICIQQYDNVYKIIILI